jgi:hypothetical protein
MDSIAGIAGRLVAALNPSTAIRGASWVGRIGLSE